MKLDEIVRKLRLENITPELRIESVPKVTKGHSSDLMSDVLANAPGGSILVTNQIHVNVIAVALHAGLSAVIFSSGMTPEEKVRQKAVEEQLPLFVSAESTFDIVGELYAMGLRGH